MNRADELRCAIIERILATDSERELDLVFRFAENLIEPERPKDTRGRIVEILCRIADETLVNRIYRFTKYIYLHREGRAAE